MTEEVKEEEEDKHNEMILQFQKNEQPAGVEQQDVLRELPCASYPCLNGGTCENQEVKYKLGENTVIDYLYKCLCTDEYIGENCQNEKSICHSNPCVHGRCLENGDNTGWQCLCLPGFRGQACEEDVDECDDATLNDCSPFAVCQNSEGSYQCQCQTGYHGDGKQCIAQKVTIKLANPDICDHYMEKVHRCIIITHQLHQCGIEIDMDITGKYRTDQIVWMKHIAKLNRTSSKSTKFKDEEVEFMVSEDGKQKQFSCEESDFAENYFTVEVQNGQFPTPKFTFKIIHKSIELGPQLPNKPFGVNVYNYDLFPHTDWIGKWVLEKTHEFTILDPPAVTYQYHINSLDSNTIGYLTYYAYDSDENQVASRRFHDELDINECELETDDCDEHAECENTRQHTFAFVTQAMKAVVKNVKI
ncbi:uncharacterized protein [Ptychodera flava]|uniref:uncharacterized protein n=1 Tax=Ptychodera flava TaxID=63121 RepID=UPI003969C533